MSKGLTPGAVLPDFTLPDENGVMPACQSFRATTP
jgi:hypothetical protein